MAEVALSAAATGEKCAQAQRRLTLLRELTESLARAQAAVVKSDLRDLRRQTERQAELCRQLSSLPTPLTNGSSAAMRWGELVGQIRQAELALADLNRVYGALLRRARRTVDVFCRLLTDSAITYAPPR